MSQMKTPAGRNSAGMMVFLGLNEENGLARAAHRFGKRCPAYTAAGEKCEGSRRPQPLRKREFPPAARV